MIVSHPGMPGSREDMAARYRARKEAAVRGQLANMDPAAAGLGPADVMRRQRFQQQGDAMIAGARGVSVADFLRDNAQRDLIGAQATNARQQFAMNPSLGEKYSAEAYTGIPAHAAFEKSQAGVNNANANRITTLTPFEGQQLQAQTGAINAQIPGVTAGDVLAPGFTPKFNSKDFISGFKEGYGNNQRGKGLRPMEVGERLIDREDAQSVAAYYMKIAAIKYNKANTGKTRPIKGPNGEQQFVQATFDDLPDDEKRRLVDAELTQIGYDTTGFD